MARPTTISSEVALANAPVLLPPTNDPDAALAFCQALAQALAAGPGQFPIVAPAAPPVPDLSVVIPVYNETENIPTLYERLTTVLQGLELSYEIIFVDDGSRDGSLQMLEDLAARDPHVVCVELARNFGHQTAISAGLDLSCGKAVAVMDADLQDPPEVLPQFISRWREGYEVVYAIREQRKEIWWKRWAYSAFYRLLQRVAHIEIPLDAGDFCVMDRRVVDVLVRMPERNRFVRGIRSWIGFRQVGMAYERHARYAGKPKYTFSRLIRLALDGLISFSYMPLRISTLSGLAISLISIVLAVFYAAQRVLSGLNPPGFATLVVAILFFSGVQLITLGLIGEYVGQIFSEVKQRPLYVTRRIIGR